jgi:ParB family chromosome partitioning protein
MDVKLDRIYPNPNQPRKHFDQAELEELAQSIKESGLMEPLIVTERENGFMLIAGERRWRACKIAGVKKAVVRILKAADQKVAELALLENLQRVDLSVVEEANAYQGLIDMGMRHEEIAREMGIKQVWRIQERLNILKLNPTFQEYTLRGIITPSQAQEMSRLPRDMQGIIFDKISSGKADSYNKLRSLVNAMLFVQEQQSFIPEPSKEDKAVYDKYTRMLDSIIDLIGKSFDKDDLSILPYVMQGATQDKIARIDEIIASLNKIKRALMQSESNREVIEQISLLH